MPSRADERRESIERALVHHQISGVVRGYSPPYTGRPHWTLTLVGQSVQQFTTAQMEAVCVALAAAECHHRAAALDAANAALDEQAEAIAAGDDLDARFLRSLGADRG